MKNAHRSKFVRLDGTREVDMVSGASCFMNERCELKTIWSGGRSICWWIGNKDFQYSISRFWERYDRKTVFSTLDGAGN